MRKVIVEVEMSLDGCIGGENTAFWQQVFPFHSDDVTKYLDDILFEPDALLMGEKPTSSSQKSGQNEKANRRKR